MKNNAFPKSKRVVRGDTFTIVMRRGGCAADDCLVVFAFPHAARGDQVAPSSERVSVPRRLGVTIPKKTGNAVVRNRWKRWIRESFRTQQSLLPSGFDFVIRPKKDAIGSANALRRSLPRLAKKAASRAKQGPPPRPA